MNSKIKFFFAMMIMFCFVQNVHAKIWRVNKLSDYVAGSATQYGANVGGTLTKPVFNELSDGNTGTFSGANASNLVGDGDTIHLEGAVDPYVTSVITKRLIIIGPGYFLHENQKVSNNLLESTIDYIRLDNGSAGTQIMGIHFTGNAISIRNYANVSDIVIKRCRIDNTVYIGDGTCSNIIVIQNFFPYPSAGSINGVAIQPSSNGCPSALIFNNNICGRKIGTIANNAVINMQQCNNNTFNPPANSGAASLKFIAAECKNNIIKTTGILVDVNGNNNSNFEYNTSVVTSELLGNGVTNVFASDIVTLFVNNGTTDGSFQLNPASSDNIPGADSTERGAFGGAAITNHYTLSGLPPIPVIYEITTTGVSDATGLPVTIKARTIQ